jgi:hypothetical protein
MKNEHKEQVSTEPSNVLYTLLGNVFDDKLMQNEEEVKTINNELLKRAENILNEFGPEGAYKMAEFLRMIADKDIEQGMQL